MDYIVWNECYVAGGADWSLIDLLTHWPKKEDRFFVCVNKTHEGLGLLKEKLPSNSEVLEFESAYEKSFSHPEFLNRSGIFKFKIFRMILLAFYFSTSFFSFKKFFVSKKYAALIMNNGGYPGGFSNFMAALLAKRYGISKSFMIVRNYPGTHYKRNIGMNLCKVISNFAIDKVISVSDSLNNSMVELSGIDREKLIRIHNGISLTNKDGSNDVNIETTSPSAAIIGALQERKGHRLLFRSWADVIRKYPSAVLYVVGSKKSGDFEGLNTLTHELGIDKNIVWIDFLNNVAPIYKKVDIVIMPSSVYESFGRIVVEAMAFNRPIVAARVGGIPEIISHGKDGYLFDKENSEQLTTYICSLFESVETREQMGRNGKDKFDHYFNAERMSNEYFELISKY